MYKAFVFSLAALSIASSLPAQAPPVFATGLQSPSKIVLTASGNLLVTECGQTPNSGRVSLINGSGIRSTLIDGLPSGLAAPDNSADGENGLAIDGRKLYVAVGEGDSHSNGTKPNTIVPNPAGMSSPIFSSVLTFTFTNDLDKIAANFSLKAADQLTLADGGTVTLTNTAGDQATVQLLAAFRDIPDANSIYRNSHPYSLALLNGSLYLADAGMNTVRKIDVTTGRSTVAGRFAPTRNPLPFGPPVSEAVPTSVIAYGSHLLVSLLGGAPFAPGISSVMDLDPATGIAVPFIPLLSSTIDVGYQNKSDGNIVFYALEYSLGLGATPPAPGALFFANTNGTSGTVVGGLNGPSSLAVDPATGAIYIASRADGTVVKIAGK